jgi:CHAD domain-containing protein
MNEASQAPQPTAPPTMAGPFLVSKLTALDERLQAASPRLMASAEDEHAVHDLRVALRRTRTVLEVGRAVLGRFHANEARRALRDVQRATGDLRDEEVLLEVFASLGVEDPAALAWIEARRSREKRLRRALVKSLRDGQLASGRRVLGALLTFPVKPSRDKRLSKIARRAVEKARRDVLKLRAAPLDDAEALHRLRIAYKRLRYVVETFSEALPPALAALAQPASRFQGRLGDLHDIDVAASAVRRARALPESARLELLGALERARDERVASYARDIGVVNIAPVPRMSPAHVERAERPSTPPPPGPTAELPARPKGSGNTGQKTDGQPARNGRLPESHGGQGADVEHPPPQRPRHGPARSSLDPPSGV